MVVLKNLQDPHGRVAVARSEVNEKDAVALQKRFMKLKWTERGRNLYTIGDVVLTIERIITDEGV